MTIQNDGLCCSGDLSAARGDPRNNRPTVTRNATDLRVARQRARAVVGEIEGEVRTYLLEQGGLSLVETGRYGELNQIVTRMAGTRFRNGLVAWLEERRLMTMARAVRAAFDLMQRALGITDEEFPGTPTITPRDRALNQELTNLDAGLLYRDADSLAESVGNRITRTLRHGFALNETGEKLADRIEFVLSESDREGADVSGMTTRQHAELIAHDSVQEAYITAAHRRYLNNGFRYGEYDATIDLKTSDLCRRLNDYCIDLVEHPELVPPNHPHCRSGLRPSFECETVLSPDDIADGHLATIHRNSSYRPTVMDTEEEYRPTALTQQFIEDQS